MNLIRPIANSNSIQLIRLVVLVTLPTIFFSLALTVAAASSTSLSEVPRALTFTALLRVAACQLKLNNHQRTTVL